MAENSAHLDERDTDRVCGFFVHDIGAQGFNVEIKVAWPRAKPPVADDVQNTLTAVYAKAFDQVEKRLGK